MNRMPVSTQSAAKLVGFLLLAALTGIVGNRADAKFLEALPLLSFLNYTIKIKLWSLILLLLIIPSPALYILLKYQKALKRLSRLNQLDDRLLRLLVKLNNKANTVDTNNGFLQDFLKDALVALDATDSCGISIYCRDPGDLNYLMRWKWYSYPSLPMTESLRFYLGDSDQGDNSIRRGVMGTTFRDKEVRIVHLYVKKEGRWEADNPDYIMSSECPPPYPALITMALTTNMHDDTPSLGVLCLYSTNVQAFDSPQVRALVKSLAQRLSIIMLTMGFQKRQVW